MKENDFLKCFKQFDCILHTWHVSKKKSSEEYDYEGNGFIVVSRKCIRKGNKKDTINIKTASSKERLIQSPAVTDSIEEKIRSSGIGNGERDDAMVDLSNTRDKLLETN